MNIKNSQLTNTNITNNSQKSKILDSKLNTFRQQAQAVSVGSQNKIKMDFVCSIGQLNHISPYINGKLKTGKNSPKRDEFSLQNKINNEKITLIEDNVTYVQTDFQKSKKPSKNFEANYNNYEAIMTSPNTIIRPSSQNENTTLPYKIPEMMKNINQIPQKNIKMLNNSKIVVPSSNRTQTSQQKIQTISPIQPSSLLIKPPIKNLIDAASSLAPQLKKKVAEKKSSTKDTNTTNKTTISTVGTNAKASIVATKKPSKNFTKIGSPISPAKPNEKPNCLSPQIITKKPQLLSTISNKKSIDNKLICNNNEHAKQQSKPKNIPITQGFSADSKILQTRPGSSIKITIRQDKPYKNVSNLNSHVLNTLVNYNVVKKPTIMTQENSRKSSQEKIETEVIEEKNTISNYMAKYKINKPSSNYNFKQMLQSSKITGNKKINISLNQTVGKMKNPEEPRILTTQASKKSLHGSISVQKPVSQNKKMISSTISTQIKKPQSSMGKIFEINYQITSPNDQQYSNPSIVINTIANNQNSSNFSQFKKAEIKKPFATEKNSPKHSDKIMNFSLGKNMQKISGYASNNEAEKPVIVSLKESLINNETVNCVDENANAFKKEAEMLSEYIKNYYQKNKEYPPTSLKFYKVGRLLGRGAFGKVNLGLHILTGRLVAIKSFNKSVLQNEKSKRKILHEVNIMKNLKQMNVVKIFETFETQKYLIIIMEYVSGGDLLTYVKKRNKLSEAVARYIFKQIILGLEFTHSQNVIHRDIKLDNILLDIHNQIKICDFGVGKQVKKRKEIMFDQCGTPAYIAPEILKGDGYEGPQVDYWSSGVVLYAMLSGTVPFKANDMSELHKIISSGKFLEIEGVSKEVNNLLHGILEIDPKKRFGADEILSHPWFFDANENGTDVKSNFFNFSGIICKY